ncbi:MAG: RNA ligase, DRB0094 family [uncultured bacterium]|nr:MAG: RNA ligase, DRB0094 family [uncultured bacterium]
MRKLASIRKVDGIIPHDNADTLEIAAVGGWQVVVKKDSFKTGDLACFCEVDSFLPIKPEYEFLRKGCFKKMPDGSEGFRLKTIKLRGVLSQGLLLPLSILPPTVTVGEGDDVTELLGVTKYEKPIPAELNGEVLGAMPSFVPKTDEERIQNLDPSLYAGKTLYATEKLDGTSVTFYLKGGVNGTLGVCGRNWEYKETDNNTYWRAARQYELETKLKLLDGNIALQGELIGHGIQGNYYRLAKIEVYFFTAYDIEAGRRLPRPEFVNLIDKLGLKRVPDVEAKTTNYLEEANGMSTLNPTVEREGLVFRDEENTISLKAVSNLYLLKNE